MVEYIYIAQQQKEETRVKIGKTGDYETRLKQYNGTGTPKDNQYNYLFVAEVKNMTEMENDIKEKYKDFREQANKEMYVWIPSTNKSIIDFIQNHPLFIKAIKTQKPKEITKIIKKTTPSMIDRATTRQGILVKAQKIKNDEFYTRYEDIEKEVVMYDANVWENKVVFCNCDDPYDATNETRSSAFALYFYNNFKKLKLKKLICLHYSGGDDLFDKGKKSGIIFTTDGKKWEQETPKNYNGSFDHPLSIKILNEEADIVCTNPPFSKSIEYWDLLIKSKKKFLIVSNDSIVIMTAYIKYFKNKKVWSGHNKICKFLNYKKEIGEAPGYWYTNFKIKDRPKYKNLKIVPLKDIPDEHRKIDDKGILLFDDNYIPSDYELPFGVYSYPIHNGILEKGYKIVDEKKYYPHIKGKEKFSRVLIQKI
ncbi:MAG: hypothetical protein Ta2D_03870 [Rickettsiales bacterium]|nr:MAG: hypothetical protein Ta2D_03870 [Rickettsiales bacterium]